MKRLQVARGVLRQEFKPSIGEWSLRTYMRADVVHKEQDVTVVGSHLCVQSHQPSHTNLRVHPAIEDVGVFYTKLLIDVITAQSNWLDSRANEEKWKFVAPISVGANAERQTRLVVFVPGELSPPRQCSVHLLPIVNEVSSVL